MKKLFPLLLTALAVARVDAAALQQEELLEPEKAFALSTQVDDAQTVTARWKIAKGYYLYREKFKFESLDDGIVIKSPLLPPGIKKHDEFFGEVETYRDQVAVKLALARTKRTEQDIKLRLTVQGCADIGVCYPPLTQVVSLRLPASEAPTGAPKSGQIKSLDDLRRLIDPAVSGNQQDEFLHPDQAFVPTIEPAGADALIARIQIAPGYYLYRDKTRFELTRGDGLKLGAYELPRGKVKVDEFIGKTEVHYGLLEVRLPLERIGAGANDIEISASYQGCAEKGICYPPTTKKLSLNLLAGSAAVASGPAAPADTAAPAKTSGFKFLIAVAAAFGTGLLLTFTPCVLPMIPILSSIIVGQTTQGRAITKLRGGLLASSYVLGTTVTYTAAGVLAGASGEQLQAYFQNPYAIGTFSVIFVLLALSMFGFYELQMPSFIQSRLQQRTQHVRGGSLVGTFALGLLSALIVGACVSPLLISALGVAISSKDPVLGGAIMFSMALGMGVILIAIGVGAGFLLPKAGPWMNTVKYVFGVLLLAVAIYVLGALPQVPVLFLWAALLIVTGVYLGATQPLPVEASGWRYLWKGTGTFMLVWGTLALIGGFMGERDIVRPLPQASLAGLAGAAPAAIVPATAGGELFHRHATLAGIESAMADARRQGKPVILDFYATWCTDCVRMEKGTFSDARVRAAMARFALLQADVTETNDATRAIKQRFGVLGPPAILFFDASGGEKTELRFYGYRNVDEFLAMLSKV